MVNSSFSAQSVPELIAYAKSNPGKISMGSAGTGTAPHVTGELFKMKFGLDLTMVPFTTDGEGNEIVTFAFRPL